MNIRINDRQRLDSVRYAPATIPRIAPLSQKAGRRFLLALAVYRPSPMEFRLDKSECFEKLYVISSAACRVRNMFGLLIFN
jgi:hypothetical protein